MQHSASTSNGKILTTLILIASSSFLLSLFLIIWYVPVFSKLRNLYLCFTLAGGGAALILGWNGLAASKISVISLINIPLIIFSSAAPLAALEVLFSHVPVSHNSSHPLAQQLWYRKYWKVNRWGFRDREHSDADLKRKHKVFIIGDSFVAGAGIKNTRDRFSDQLSRNLSSRNLVITLGRPGADTNIEYGILSEFPVKPNVVIFSYYLNDILGTSSAQKYWSFSKGSGTGIQEWLASFSSKSFLFSFLYDSVSLASPVLSSPYFENLKEAYLDPKVFSDHLNEIEKVISFSQSNNAKLLVVIFPILQDLRGSAPIINKLGSFFEDKNIDVVQVADLVKDLSPSERIVNNQDAHPSKIVHLRVADKLFAILKNKFDID